MAVIIVCAGRRDGVHNQAWRVAELRRKAIGDKLNFADKKLGDRHQANAGPIRLRVVVAVELVVGSARVAIGVDARDAEFNIWAACDVGLKQGKVVRVARDERQVVYLNCIHHTPQINLCRIGYRSVSTDGHYFRNLTGLQSQSDGGRLSSGQSDSFAHKLLEV